MAWLTEAAANHLGPTQAAELARVIDLEARWENLRANQPAPGHGTLDLLNRQRTYEAYRSRLAEYTAQYRTLRVPELTPNGADRLGAWCRALRAVLRRAESAAGEPPVHAVEKAHRLAERIAGRLKSAPAGRGTPPNGISAAIRELATIGSLCNR